MVTVDLHIFFLFKNSCLRRSPYRAFPNLYRHCLQRHSACLLDWSHDSHTSRQQWIAPEFSVRDPELERGVYRRECLVSNVPGGRSWIGLLAGVLDWECSPGVWDWEWSAGAHSGHRFPAPSSKLCQIWLRHWRVTLYLRAAVQRRSQQPPKGCGSNTESKHALKHKACPPRVEKNVPSPLNWFWVCLCWRKQRGRLYKNRLIENELPVADLLPSEH